MSLDERMRRRMLDLSQRTERGERSPLSPEARDRIARAVAREGALAIRRQRTMATLGVATVGLAAAAAVTLVVRTPSAPVLPSRDAPELAAVAPARACAAWEASGAGGGLVPARRVEVDRRARLVTRESSIATYAASTGCETRVDLVDGTVDVWARNLGGGDLFVRSGDVTVHVRGTVFGVSHEGDATTVRVDEGKVEVRSPAIGAVFVLPGERLRVEGGSVVRGSLEPAERAELHGIVEDAPAVAVAPAAPAPQAPAVAPASQASAPAMSTPETLAAAERAFREGRVDEARRLFRTVGVSRDPEAEAAWLRLGRLELRAGRPTQAAAALAEHRRRFPAGRLSAEALYLEAGARRSMGDASRARELEDRLLAVHPESPQAERVRASRETPAP